MFIYTKGMVAKKIKTVTIKDSKKVFDMLNGYIYLAHQMDKYIRTPLCK